MKKIVALLLALVMTLSLGTVAFAEGEGTNVGITKLTEITANVAAGLLYYPAQYMAEALDQINEDGEVIAMVDEVCGKINETVHTLYDTVHGTVVMATNLVETAKVAANFGGWILKLFGMDAEQIQDWIIQIDESMEPIADFDEFVVNIEKWTGKVEKPATSQARTFAGDHVAAKIAEIAGFLKDKTNFVTYGDGAFVATAIYKMIENYYLSNTAK